MHLQSSYPVVMVESVVSASAFFVDHLGFARTFANDWYVSLRHPAPPHPELGFVRFDHATVPAEHRAPSRGLLLNVEVADAHAAWRALSDAGARVLLPLRDEPFGQRHFILETPAGLLVDVIQNIPPAPEFASQFVDDAAHV